MGDKFEFYMKIALEEAEKAHGQGEVPVGAVLAAGEQILARGYNSSIQTHDPTAHAEMNVIRQAARIRQNYRLPDCDVYVTLEPCAMCLGAMVQARIRRLVFGAYDPKAGAVSSIMDFPFAKTNHRMEIKGGILAEECGKILKDFFRRKR